MSPARPGAAELRAVARLALPIVVVQVGIMLMGVVDTMMVGRVSAAALAAVALGNLYWVGPAIFAQGVLMVLDPVVSQAVGAGDRPAIGRALQRGLLLALALALAMSATLLPVRPVLTALRQPADVVPVASAYVLASIPGALPYVVFVMLRQALQAMTSIGAIVVTIVAANAANALLNWMLIFGALGAPAMGPVGSAWASTASRWLMMLGLVVLGWPQLRPHLRPWRRESLHPGPLGRMLRLGVPIGATLMLEYAAFAAIGLLMGLLGTVAMAGHQVALNLASLAFMVPLGVSAAAAVLVGQAVGRGDLPGARRAAAAALACGAGFMVLSAVAFLLAPGALAALYTDQPTVLRVAIALIPIAGIFQVFDGVQVVGAGVLRGVGDTRAPLLVNILGFWLLGMPVSIYLGFGTPAGPVGLWWGLVAGLAAVAAFLVARIRHRLRRDVRRVTLDDDPLPTGAPR